MVKMSIRVQDTTLMPHVFWDPRVEEWRRSWDTYYELFVTAPRAEVFPFVTFTHDLASVVQKDIFSLIPFSQGIPDAPLYVALEGLVGRIGSGLQCRFRIHVHHWGLIRVDFERLKKEIPYHWRLVETFREQRRERHEGSQTESRDDGDKSPHRPPEETQFPVAKEQDWACREWKDRAKGLRRAVSAPDLSLPHD